MGSATHMYAQLLGHVQLLVTLWTIVRQVPLSMGFLRQEYWSGLPFPPPGDLPNPGIKPTSLVFPALGGGFFTTVPPGKPTKSTRGHINAGATRVRTIQPPLESLLGLKSLLGLDQPNSRVGSCIVLIFCHYQYWELFWSLHFLHLPVSFVLSTTAQPLMDNFIQVLMLSWPLCYQC